jgi:DNA-binding MurR/RpiR family transcriptional regulator
MSKELTVLPELPEHYNPLKALPAAEKAKLLDTILAHYENGTSIYELAEKLGVNNATIYRALVKHRTEDWKEVRGARYHAQIEQAEKDMQEATDPLAVTRAREQLANARWMLERLQRSIYGQDQQQDGSSGRVSIVLNIGQQRSEPLDVVGEDDIRIANQSK